MNGCTRGFNTKNYDHILPLNSSASDNVLVRDYSSQRDMASIQFPVVVESIVISMQCWPAPSVLPHSEEISFLVLDKVSSSHASTREQ